MLAGGTVSNRPGLFQLGSPVRFSPSQSHIGIYLVETVQDLITRGHFQILHRNDFKLIYLFSK